MAMRIDLVTETFPPEVNGVAMTLSRLTAELRRRGHEVRVIRPRQRHEHLAAHAGEILVPGLPIPLYPEMQIGLPAFGRLKELWKGQPPDLLHVATEGPLGWSALRTARRLGIPSITSFHTNFHDYLKDYGLSWLKPLCVAWLRHVHAHGRAMLVPDWGLIAELEGYGFRNGRLFGRGVDTELFSPDRRDESLRREWGTRNGETVYLHVSRVAREKNIPFVLDLYRKELLRREPEARMVVVGDGPELPRLRRKYPEVHFAGMRHAEDLARHYASADVFLFASRSETFGNVITEALASGLEVITHDYAAGRQYIRDGENGHLVPCFDGAGFTGEALASGGKEAPLMRMRARQTAEGIPWGGVVDGYEAVLRDVLER